MKTGKILSAVLSGAASALLTAGVLTASAETTVGISADQAGDNEKVQVTITFQSDDKDLGSLGGALYYDDSLLEFTSGDGSGGGGIVNFQAFPMDESGIITIELGFEPKASGISGLYIENCYVFSYDGIVLAEPTAETTIQFTAGETAPATDESKPETTVSETTAPAEKDAPESSLAAETTTTTMKEENGTAETEAPIETEAAAVTEVSEEVSHQETQETDEETEINDESSPKSSSSLSQPDTDDKYKRTLNPALAIVLVVLVVSLVMVIVHLKNSLGKSRKKRRK